MSDEEALEILNKSEWFDSAQAVGQQHPDWHAAWTGTLKVRLDGRFSRDELLALLHFHPDTHV